MKSSGAHFGCRVLFYDKDNQIIAHYRSLKKVDPLARIEECVKKMRDSQPSFRKSKIMIIASIVTKKNPMCIE